MGMIILNGKEYTSAPKDGFPPIIYSDEEREIGVWRDGKPLYEKTIYTGILTKDTNWHDISAGVENIDKCANISGIAFADDDSYYSLPTYRPGFSNGVLLNLYKDNNQNWQVSYINNFLDPATAYITFRYTKTTDTPGSGKYTTYGGLTHHYSENEQVVGTWIDGKPLYEKTVDCGAGPNKTTKSVAHNIANLKDVVNFGGYMRASSYSTPIFKINDASANNQAVIEVSDTAINIISRNNNISALNCIVILQYTKTTD